MAHARSYGNKCDRGSDGCQRATLLRTVEKRHRVMHIGSVRSVAVLLWAGHSADRKAHSSINEQTLGPKPPH